MPSSSVWLVSTYIEVDRSSFLALYGWVREKEEILERFHTAAVTLGGGIKFFWLNVEN